MFTQRVLVIPRGFSVSQVTSHQLLGPRNFNGQRLREVFAEVPTASPCEELCAGLGVGNSLVRPLEGEIGVYHAVYVYIYTIYNINISYIYIYIYIYISYIYTYISCINIYIFLSLSLSVPTGSWNMGLSENLREYPKFTCLPSFSPLNLPCFGDRPHVQTGWGFCWWTPCYGRCFSLWGIQGRWLARGGGHEGMRWTKICVNFGWVISLTLLTHSKLIDQHML